MYIYIYYVFCILYIYIYTYTYYYVISYMYKILLCTVSPLACFLHISYDDTLRILAVQLEARLIADAQQQERDQDRRFA